MLLLDSMIRSQQVSDSKSEIRSQNQKESANANKPGLSRKRKVKFAGEEKKTFCAPLFETLTTDKCLELWYQQHEIASFKASTRWLIMFGKRQSDDCLSGLERFNFERSKNKKSAIRCVVLAQKQQKGPDFMRLVSRKCSGWALDLGMIQGFNDFVQVYDPLKGLLADGSSENYNEYFFGERKRKTTAAAEEADERKVKQRLPPDPKLFAIGL